MRIAKQLLFFILLLGIVTSVSANTHEVLLYNTYEDYKAQKGEKLNDYKTWFATNGVITLVFFKNGEKERINPRKIWGFTYKGALFRVCKETGEPVRLISTSKIHYYENGVAHLSLLKDNVLNSLDLEPNQCYISESIESEVILLKPLKKAQSNSKIKELMVSHPEYKSLFNCIDFVNRADYPRIRKCIEQFQGS